MDTDFVFVIKSEIEDKIEYEIETLEEKNERNRLKFKWSPEHIKGGDVRKPVLRVPSPSDFSPWYS